MNKLKIYCAGGISGLTQEDVLSRYEKLREDLSDNFTLIIPMVQKNLMRNKIEHKSQNKSTSPITENKSIVRRDRWNVSQADILLVDLTMSSERISIGSVSEMAWGYDDCKNIIVIMPQGNIHRHAFVLEMASIVFESYEEALAYLREYSSFNYVID